MLVKKKKKKKLYIKIRATLHFTLEIKSIFIHDK